MLLLDVHYFQNVIPITAESHLYFYCGDFKYITLESTISIHSNHSPPGLDSDRTPSGITIIKPLWFIF
jgi:hypothetical protein